MRWGRAGVWGSRAAGPVTAAPPLHAVSHHYGYGLLDSALLVDLARTWLPTEPQRKCVEEIVLDPL